jgi:hypothetical protein
VVTNGSLESSRKMNRSIGLFSLVGRGALVPVGAGFRSLKSNWD